MVQLSDLHASDGVPLRYLQEVVHRVNEAKPDLVVVTGDLVTHDPDWIEPISRVLSTLQVPVVASFGNHELLDGAIRQNTPTNGSPTNWRDG